MRILVTGASGFVGQHLLRTLLDTGEHEIYGGTLDGAPAASETLPADLIRRVEWLEVDVTSDASVTGAVETIRPEQVYHLAGQSSVSGSFQDPLGTWDVNATGTARLVEALQKLKDARARLLLISSAEVYGDVPTDQQPIPESCALSPATPYGASKAAAEMAGLQAAHAGSLEVVVARSFNHTGPGQDTRFALPGMASRLMDIRGDPDPILRVGNLSAARDFLDVRDVVSAYRLLMQKGSTGTVYNVCSGQSVALSTLVDRLVELSGTGARVEIEKAWFRDVDAERLTGDPRALIALGWQRRIPLDQTLRDLLSSVGIEPVDDAPAPVWEPAGVQSECLPLAGKAIVVTRARAQAGEFIEQLQQLGAEVIPFPTIRITDPTDPLPLRGAVAQADTFDWIVFTSVNGVERFWEELRASGRDTRVLAGVSICAIGPATAAAVDEQGARADLVPDEYVAEAVVEALAAETDLQGVRILIPRAEVARSVLPTSLRERGAIVVEVAAYRSKPDGPQAEEMERRLRAGEVHLITFTASSTVRNYVELVGTDTGGARIASIGPITSQTARELGLTVDIEAEDYTIPGLLEAIRRYYEE